MPIILAACGGSLCLVLAYALLRWHENLARGFARGPYLLQQRLIPAALRARMSYWLWPNRIFVLLLAAICVPVGVVLWLAVIRFLIDMLTGSVPTDIWHGPPKTVHGSYSGLDVTLWAVFGAFHLTAGIYYLLLARRWLARVLYWFWDVDLPLDVPYPRKDDCAAAPPHPRYFLSAAGLSAVLILIGIAGLVACVRVLLLLR